MDILKGLEEDRLRQKERGEGIRKRERGPWGRGEEKQEKEKRKG